MPTPAELAESHQIAPWTTVGVELRRRQIFAKGSSMP
jgi:hypothetical protein